MEKKTMPAMKVFMLSGALLAYLIGSGFASGQETMQFFSGYGWMSIGVGIFNFVMMYVTYVAYAYAGRTRGLKDLKEVCTFYTNAAIGKLFEIFAWIFSGCCYFFMCSGAASTLNQQFGIPIWIGLLIIVGLSLVTAYFGLGRICDVIGWIGPVVVIFTLIIGLISAFTYFPKISEGIELINNGTAVVNKGTSHWITAGLSFGGCSLLLVSNFVATLAHENREYKFGRFKFVLFTGAFFISTVSVLMGMNHVGNIMESSVVDIPNLALANHILGSVGALFAIIIFLAIYSTVCPCLWNTIKFFSKDEKGKGYKLGCVAMAVIAYIVCMFVPYQTLLGFIMTYCGYTGAIVFVVIVVRYFIVKAKDKKEGTIA